MRLRAEDVEARSPPIHTSTYTKLNRTKPFVLITLALGSWREAKQREEQDTKMERGYAALQRVQQRAMQD